MQPDGSFDAKDAAIGIVVAAVCADGRRVRPEVRFGADALARLAPFRVTFTDVATRLEWMGGILEREGADAFVARCLAALPADLRPLALAAASGVVAADAEATEAEMSFLADLARRMGLAPP